VSPSGWWTLQQYIESFLEDPSIALGAAARLAAAFEAGAPEGTPAWFIEKVRSVALGPDPFVPPVLVVAPEQETAERYALTLGRAITGGGAEEKGPLTFSWREGEELLPCPYRHDPLLLLPETSREEILSSARQSAGGAYPLVLDSRTHCPWCAQRYGKALARAEGVWEKLAEQVLVHRWEPLGEAGACPGAVIMSANRGSAVARMDDPYLLPLIRRAMEGGEGWPRVVGFVFLPLSARTYDSWLSVPEFAGALQSSWVVSL